MKNFGPKQEISLDQKLITQMIMIKNVWKSNLIQMDDLPLKKTLDLHMVLIVVRAIFQKDKKHYPQAFLDECLYRL